MYKYITSCIFIFIFIFIVCITPVKANDEVIFVSSYSESIEAKRGMFPVLIKNFKLDFNKHIFYLNSKGKSIDIVKQQSIPILKAIKEINPNIVFLTDDNALKFLGPELAQNDIKIVALGINGNPRTYFNPNDFHNVYGVLERPLFLRGIIEISNLIGYKDNVIIMFDDSQSGKIIIKSLFKDRVMINISDTTTIKYIVVKNLDDIQRKLKHVDKQNTHLFLGSIHSIKKGEQNAELLSFHEVLNWLTDYYQLDYYGFWKDYVIVNGAHISYGVDLADHATTALGIAYQILNDLSPKPRFITLDKGQHFQLEE